VLILAKKRFLCLSFFSFLASRGYFDSWSKNYFVISNWNIGFYCRFRGILPDPMICGPDPKTVIPDHAFMEKYQTFEAGPLDSRSKHSRPNAVSVYQVYSFPVASYPWEGPHFSPLLPKRLCAPLLDSKNNDWLQICLLRLPSRDQSSDQRRNAPTFKKIPVVCRAGKFYTFSCHAMYIDPGVINIRTGSSGIAQRQSCRKSYAYTTQPTDLC